MQSTQPVTLQLVMEFRAVALPKEGAPQADLDRFARAVSEAHRNGFTSALYTFPGVVLLGKAVGGAQVMLDVSRVVLPVGGPLETARPQA